MASDFITYLFHKKYTWNVSHQEWKNPPPGYKKYERPGNDLVMYQNGYAMQVGGTIQEFEQYVIP